MRIVVVLLAGMLAGCAGSASLPLAEAKHAPAERVLWRPPAGEHATLLLVRDAGMAGSALWVYASVDGIPAAQLDPGEAAELRVSPGPHTVSAVGKGALNLEGNRPMSLDLLLPAGTRAVVRFGFSDRGQMSMWRDASPN